MSANVILGLRPSASITLIFGLLSTTVCYALEQTVAVANAAPETVANSDPVDSENGYVFDRTLFRGSTLNKDALIHLSQGNSITAGIYKVDLYVNNHFVEHSNIRFIEHQQQILPCFELDQLKRSSVITLTTLSPDQKNNCALLENLVAAGSSHFDVSRLRLDLSIPNTLLKQNPIGYVNPSEWNAGESIGFINYMANYFYNVFDVAGQVSKHDSAYMSLNGGINLGKWQFRQQSNLTYHERITQWNNIRSHLKRPIQSIQSEFSLGQLNSSGRFFSGLSFNGINLSSDDRMLPASVRGYAPVIQGVARTNARVSIQQNGREIYQITVAPGPFKINDLFPTNSSGDLNVMIYEADGSTSEFRVPFFAAAESIRQGAFKYNLDLGRTRDIGEDTHFANLTTQYGLNNAITLNSGVRIADGYQAAMLGSAYSNRFGAFSANLTYSHATLAQSEHPQLNDTQQTSAQGWMLSTSYSKTLQSSNTSLIVTGYRFSTQGYRELSDLIALRQSIKDGIPFQSNTDQERSRLTLSINQRLGEMGNIYITGSAQNYRDNKANDYQLQLGYSKAWINGVSVNLSMTKLQRGYHGARNSDAALGSLNNNTSSDTSIGLSLNIPLSHKTYTPKSLMFSSHHNGQNNSYQGNVNGTLDQKSTLNYSLGLSYNDQSQQRNWSAALQKRMPNINVDVSASMGQFYWQTATNIQGALAIHSKGITFGSYLSDTFALIEAQGATGAQVLNTQGASINRFGFALVPSLTPYQYNNIALNPEGMSDQVELQSGNQKVVPYAGAAVKIKFNTRQGFAMLIRSQFESGMVLPLGAEVFDETASNVGIVGQNGQIYLRAKQASGKLQVKWGENKIDSCSIEYTISDQQSQASLIKFSSICKVDN